MGNFTIKRLNFFKSLFFVVLFFAFVPAKANVAFTDTPASPFFQRIYLNNCTATTLVFKAATFCKLECYGSIELSKNNTYQKLIKYTTICDNPVLIIKKDISVEVSFLFNSQIINSFI